MNITPTAAALELLERLYAEFTARPVSAAEPVLGVTPRPTLADAFADMETGALGAKMPSTIEPGESIIAMRISELRERLGGSLRP